MLELIKELFYIEMSGNSLMLNVKWLAVCPLILVQLWLWKRTFQSFQTKKK